MEAEQSKGVAAFMTILPACETCGDTGWLCAGTGEQADFVNGTCCHPWESEFALILGRGCPSADGCPDCDAGGRINA